MLDPSDATSSVDWKDLDGSLLVFKVHAVEVGLNTSHGEAQAVRADIVVLDGDLADDADIPTLVFPKLLISQLKPKIGGIVLGRLGQGKAKSDQAARWTLSEATEADKAIARSYLGRATMPAF